MRPADGLLADGGYCLAKFGEVYAVYLPNGGKTSIDLSWDGGTYTLKWYNPRRGGELIDDPRGAIDLAKTPKPTIGPPPASGGQDWVALLRNTSPAKDRPAPPKTIDVAGIGRTK